MLTVPATDPLRSTLAACGSVAPSLNRSSVVMTSFPAVPLMTTVLTRSPRTSRRGVVRRRDFFTSNPQVDNYGRKAGNVGTQGAHTGCHYGATWSWNVCVAAPPKGSEARMLTLWTPTWFFAGTQWMAQVSGSMVIPSGPSTRLRATGSPSGSVTTGWYRNVWPTR